MPNQPIPETTATAPKSKPSKPASKRPRVDPEILKLRKKHAFEVSEYLRKRASAALLKTITDKRLPKLVQADREKLLDTLMLNTTRCFPAMLKADNACACTIDPAPVEAEAVEKETVCSADSMCACAERNGKS